MISSYTFGRQPEPEEIATPEQRSNRACLLWQCERDLAPLMKVLKAGEANADAQALAGDLLMAATKKKLPDTPRHVMRDQLIVTSWLMFQNMGGGAEQAKRTVAEQFKLSVKRVEEIVYGDQGKAMAEAIRKQLGWNV